MHFEILVEDQSGKVSLDILVHKIIGKEVVLNAYISDSICGTWELLADAVYKGGFQVRDSTL
ncbi:MAG: hypothetical protein Q7U38_16515 [Methylobacter sp.]|nr:hypothetical protein [Methylobacter sp.]MDP2099623.1 hypothetical protein [Methylobacter sp.]MDP2429819.1 hypothetical protein [Methylobacter sp.]MDP3055539.1 hypothetical protein [Methylobacter sp.]MDP3361345.1 hypothetical protein [Methylobacter sp.]